jgi:copper homeostasis protein
MPDVLREFCAENFTDIPRVVAAGVERIELCDNLAVGGTTPSYGVIAASAREIGAKATVLSVMIRPRGGDFVYNDAELEIMALDIEKAIEAGADSLVFGVLDAAGNLNVEAMRALIARAGDTPVVCHMAFDAVADPSATLEQLIDLGVKLVLTHGAPAGQPLGVDRLKALVRQSDGRIDLMIGGGVNAANCESYATAVGTNFAHGTGII